MGQADAQNAIPADDAMARFCMMTRIMPKNRTAAGNPGIIKGSTESLRDSQKVPAPDRSQARDRPDKAFNTLLGGDPGQPCGMRGERYDDGPGLMKTLQNVICAIKG